MNILNKEKILEQARAFTNEGRFDKAIREYEKILMADPGDLRVKLRVAELYTKRKQIQEAIRIYQEVADSYVAEGFYLKAVTVYKSILRINPALTEINDRLADVYERMGLISDAVRQYGILASALESKGISDRLLDVRSRIVKLCPNDGTARIKLAELYQRKGQMDAALDQYEEYSKQMEESGGDRAKLAETYEKIVSYRPDRHDLLRKLIAVLDELGDTARTLKWLEQGKDLVERDPGLLALAARLYAMKNQNETARGKYMALAELYCSAGEKDAALDAYCEVLVLFPDEEDRFAKRIEEIEPGALSRIVDRARMRREQIEAEGSRREEAKAEGEIHEGFAAPLEKEELSVKPPASKLAAKEAQTQEGPRARPVAPSRAEADAAYDLAMVYDKTGLEEEARSEFEKALRIYVAIVGAGKADPVVVERVEKIRGAQGGAGESPKSSEERRRAMESAGGRAGEAPLPRGDDGKAKDKRKKKKISYI